EAIANYDNNNFFIPFLYKHANLRNASAGIDEAYRNKIGYSSLKPNDYQALFRNREFENLVGSRF
ncbi:MAG: hypothetical protein HRU12_06585, partial [Phaeodactylibacter sp.]|nr:hypothetical protein [Phaeodactylibacter sp.]